ncbi:AraC family transcriptional regulator [Flavobacterium rivuli WB 3.3-2 = DSM 21788]|uniref:AraC family transcriptional regulator n=1 Tax=Flavobacterium rivuli WB 3.3-2 = DSM 21788 TaxID=1121895 RepID=A0A0A2M144_9FLAO|nr:AraC family transcriptional regulator [Flavobacterium rivuli]KGO86362.1 AraC family transcriptional regulator [Flavobacterium rivuli WB 3.3-2 = DSM 21788]
MKTLKPSFEVIEPSFGSSFTYTSYVQNANIRSHVWHYHPEVELVFVNGGAGKRQIGSHISYYNDGDLILIGSNLPHCGFTDDTTGNTHETVIQMKPDFLGEGFMQLPETKNLAGIFERAKRGIAFSPETRKAVGEKLEAMEEMMPFERLLGMIHVLNELEQATDYKVLNAEGFALETQVQDNDRINMVFNYVKDNFKNPITLDDIAERASMTVPSFCRYFKKMTRKTFVQFVNEYRVVHACKLLAENTMSIADVSYESGFNNFSHFNKSFKEVTGRNASQYRHELRNVVAD